MVVFVPEACSRIDRQAGVAGVRAFINLYVADWSMYVYVLVFTIFALLDVDAASRQEKDQGDGNETNFEISGEMGWH
jgi:hypothetical protein